MLKRIKILQLSMMVLSLAILANVPTIQAEEIKIAGGAGPVKNVLQPVKDYFEKASGIKLAIMEMGGTVSFKELMKGNLDVATAGYSFDELLLDLKKEGIDVPDKTTYQPVVVAKANILVVVNKDNPVSKLSKEQLKGIFTGKIQSWKEVGGPDAPILITLAKLNPATNTTFKNQILDGEPYLKDIAETGTTDEVKLFVAGTAEAIAFGPSSLVGGAVKSIDTPEVSRVITFITKGSPMPKAQKLLDFVKGEGQKYIKK